MDMETKQTPVENGQPESTGPQPLGPKSFGPFLIIGLALMTGIVFSALYAEDIITKIIGEERIQAVKEARRLKKMGIDTVPKSVAVPPPDAGLTVKEDLVLWLRADALENVKNKDGVVLLPDGSGINNHASQGRRRWQPTYVPNGINGKPALRFDGKDDFLSVGTLADTSFVTVAAVWAKPKEGGQAYQRLYSSGDGGADYQVKGVFYVPKTAGQGVGASPPKIRLQRPKKQKDLRNFFVGRLNIKADPPQYFQGDLAEILVYTRRLSDEETQAVRQYLAQKYNI